MRLITNEKLIKRNTRIARASNITGLALLVGGMFIVFARPQWLNFFYLAVVLGFIFTNLSIYFSNRWLRLPRPDQALDAALKGLDDRFAIYHYRLGASHALVTPAGVFALTPKFQVGEITYESTRGRWRQKGGNTYLKLFGQEGIGNPSAEAAVEADSLARKLKQMLPDYDLPPILPVIVFTSDRAMLNAEGSPLPALHAKKLKEYIRNRPKGATLSNETLRAIDEKLGLS